MARYCRFIIKGFIGLVHQSAPRFDHASITDISVPANVPLLIRIGSIKGTSSYFISDGSSAAHELLSCR